VVFAYDAGWDEEVAAINKIYKQSVERAKQN
jgi:hypothetical protein